MRISDWSSDVCSSDLRCRKRHRCLRPACFQEEDAKDIQAGHGKRQGSIQARTVMQEKRCPMPIDIRNEDRITESTGNVFTDLGFDDAEAQVLALRADLMALLATQTKASRMTQVAADQVPGVRQGRRSEEGHV